jgi:hypothetical protein
VLQAATRGREPLSGDRLPKAARRSRLALSDAGEEVEMKRLVGAIAAGLLAGVLAGCGGGQTPSAARHSPSLNPASTAPAAETGPATTRKEQGR